MKKKLQHRILFFSFCLSILFAILALSLYFAIHIISSNKTLNDAYVENMRLIHCEKNYCLSETENDWKLRPTNFIVTSGNFFIRKTNYQNFPLNFADVKFLKKFSTPKSYISPSKEKWRFYSKEFIKNEQRVIVMAAWAEKTNYYLSETPATVQTDIALINEVGKIADQLVTRQGKLYSSGIQTIADGFQIVEVNTGRVIDWDQLTPAYFPNKLINSSNLLFVDEKHNVYLTRWFSNSDISLVFLENQGSYFIFLLTFSLIFLVFFFVFYLLGYTHLKKMLLLSDHKYSNLQNAIKRGESGVIEFKRGIVDEELLKTITAFSNTNDGAIFIGIDDGGKIKGLTFDTDKEKDLLCHKIYNLVRTRIKPSIFIKIDLEEVDGYYILKISVPRGEEPLYYFEGVIYVRHGESDIKAQPELVKDILHNYSI